MHIGGRRLTIVSSPFTRGLIRAASVLTIDNAWVWKSGELRACAILPSAEKKNRQTFELETCRAGGRARANAFRRRLTTRFVFGALRQDGFRQYQIVRKGDLEIEIVIRNDRNLLTDVVERGSFVSHGNVPG